MNYGDFKTSDDDMYSVVNGHRRRHDVIRMMEEMDREERMMRTAQVMTRIAVVLYTLGLSILATIVFSLFR